MPSFLRKTVHIAFFTTSGSAEIVPTLAVVSTLVRRGYRVTYLATDRWRSEVERLGAEFVRCRPPPNLPFTAEVIDAGSEEQFFAYIAAVLSDIEPFYQENRPDLVIHDNGGLIGRILAKGLDLPAIQATCDFQLVRRYPSRQAPEFMRHVSGWEPALKRLFAKYGIFEEVFYFYRSDLNILFYPKIFQLDGNSLDERCFYAGRCSPERPYVEKWTHRSAGGRPTILVSASTTYVNGPEYFRMCMDALAALQWNIILQVGENIDTSLLESLSPRVEIIRNAAQIGILPYVNLLICAGGMMSAVEAMYCGVPLLMMTHGHVELESYADNSVRLGLGRHLRKEEMNVQTIRDSVLGMSEDVALLDRVRQMQVVVRGEAGSEEVATRIGEYVESLK